MTDDLIKRLRARRVCKDGVARQPHKHERQAADTIEAQAAEIARLREEIMQIEVDAMEHYNDWVEHGCEPVEAIHFAFDLGQYTRAALEGKP